MGGLGTYSMILPRLLKAAGHEVVVITKYFRGAPRYEVCDGVHVYRLDHYYEWTGSTQHVDDELFSNEMNALRSYTGVFARMVARRLPALHEKHQFDVVISQELEAPTLYLQERKLLFNELSELPFILFIHSPHSQIQVFNEDSTFDRHEYHRILYEKEALSLADGLIAASAFMKGRLQEEMGFPDEAIEVIPLPVGDVPEHREGSAVPRKEGERRLIYSGRIETRKGVELLIRTVVPLLEQHSHVTLHLCGRDTEHPPLGRSFTEHLISKRIPAAVRERIFFRGYIPRSQLWAEYRAADVGVVPSLWEPFSYVCQEMMACGLPILASRGGGMPEMMGEGAGWFCEAGEEESLQSALETVLSATDSELQAKGLEAKARIHAYCDNQAVLEKTLSYVERVQAARKAELAAAGRFKVPANFPFGDRPLREPHPMAGRPLPPVERVGAVIPCYNLGNYLDECIESLVRQSRPPEQIFVVDDGSTDKRTREVLESYAGHAIVKVLHFKNGGLPVARNRGAEAALADGCDTLIFIDADDWVESEYLEKATEVLQRHPEVGVVTAWTHTIGLMHTYWVPPQTQYPFLLVECTATPPALVRARVFEEAGGFSPDQAYAYEDWDFWIAATKAGYAMLTIPEPLIRYRMRSESVSRLYTSVTREHGRRHMIRHHRDLYERYLEEVLLLEHSLRYVEETRNEHDLTELRKEVGRIKRDLEWNYNERERYQLLFADKSAKADGLATSEAALKSEVEWLRSQLEAARTGEPGVLQADASIAEQ